MEPANVASGTGSTATSCPVNERRNGLSLEAYQAIRAAVAEEVGMNSHSFAVTTTEAGAVAREGVKRREGAQARGTIVVSYNFS